MWITINSNIFNYGIMAFFLSIRDTLKHKISVGKYSLVVYNNNQKVTIQSPLFKKQRKV